MKAKSISCLFLVGFTAALLGACTPETTTKEVPTVNDENCKPENIAKIEDKTMREQFSADCLRRAPGGFKASEKKEW